MKISIVLVLATASGFAWGQDCPSSSGYVPCAYSDGTCRVPDSIDYGYISYGAEGRFILMPFTNDRANGVDLEYTCNNWIGDIRRGSRKSCCYTDRNVDTGFDTAGWTGWAEEGEYWRHYQMVSQRYGKYGQYVYRPAYNTELYCDNYRFGDPAPGTTKECQWRYGAPAGLSQAEQWTVCGNEGGMCSGLEKNAMQWVRYGDNGRWLYQLVIANDGQIDCNNDVFDDAFWDHAKHCERSPAQYSITNLVGNWQMVKQCLGCTYTQRVLEGITNMQESELTQTWGVSVTATAERDFKFGSVSMSVTVSYEAAHRTLTQETRHVEREESVECSNGYLWQWQTSGSSSNGITIKEFNWKSSEMICSDSGAKPQCPPVYCSDGDIRCQEPCRAPWTADAFPFYLLPAPQPNVPAPQPFQAPNAPLSFPWYSYAMAIAVVALLCINLTVIMTCYFKGCCNKKSPKTVQYECVEKEYQL